MSTTLDTNETTEVAHLNGDAAAASHGSLLEAAAQSGFWDKSAPKGAAADHSSKTWFRHLQKRRRPAPLTELCKTKSTPLGWGITLPSLEDATRDLLALVDELDRAKTDPSEKRRKEVVKLLDAWVAGTHRLPQSLDFAMECLAVAHALPHLVGWIDGPRWWKLLDAQHKVARSASQWRSDAALPPTEGLCQQLLAGELPLTLAATFPEIRFLQSLRSSSFEAFSEGLIELTNGNGMLQGNYLPVGRALLACWTRASVLGKRQKKGPWSRKAAEQFEWAVTQAIALSSPTGVPLLAGANEAPWSPDFLENALAAGGAAAAVEAARQFFSKKLTAGLKAKPARVEPHPSDNCEWSGVAYMHNSWQSGTTSVAVDYSTPDLRLEVWQADKCLLRGVWSWETRQGGKQLETVGTWDEVCWFSDDDVDYLELAIELSDGARLERQILLARDEEFLLLADHVIGTQSGKLTHSYRLPLAAKVEFEAEQETREGSLVASKPVARVLPLALPEWRVDPRVGQLKANGGRLQLEQSREGTGVSCPLFFDLKRCRLSKPCTWRQLTVAQALEIQPPDVAVGYRVQCGKQQWLYYRSLAKPANRTVLGQNLSIECLMARFLAPSGEIDELLEIDG